MNLEVRYDLEVARGSADEWLVSRSRFSYVKNPNQPRSVWRGMLCSVAVSTHRNPDRVSLCNQNGGLETLWSAIRDPGLFRYCLRFSGE